MWSCVEWLESLVILYFLSAQSKMWYFYLTMCRLKCIEIDLAIVAIAIENFLDIQLHLSDGKCLCASDLWSQELKAKVLVLRQGDWCLGLVLETRWLRSFEAEIIIIHSHFSGKKFLVHDTLADFRRRNV